MHIFLYLEQFVFWVGVCFVLLGSFNENCKEKQVDIKKFAKI